MKDQKPPSFYVGKKHKRGVPLARFRIYPENKSLYFTVIIWKTLGELRRDNGPGNSKTIALCRAHDRVRIFKRGDPRPDRMIQECGTVHYPQRRLRVGIITHELTHAAFAWAARKGIKLEAVRLKLNQHSIITLDDPEERFCTVLGEMCIQTVARLRKLKLIE